MGSFLLIILIAFVLVITFIIVYTRTVVTTALTEPFQAAESITKGNFPEQWVTQIDRRLALTRAIPGLQPNISGTELALHKLDKLIRFFEKSPFFEDAYARELLLAQLNETRQRWVSMTWEEIGKEYRSGADSAVDGKHQ